MQKREEVKKQQLDKYLGELKNQMEYDRKKKQEEYRMAH